MSELSVKNEEESAFRDPIGMRVMQILHLKYKSDEETKSSLSGDGS